MRRKTPIASSYLIRKTFADQIVDNFAKYNRRGYYQRIIFVARHNTAPNIVKEHITECVRKTNENLSNDILTGLCLYYENYSMYMIDGLEDVIGLFMEQIISIKDIIFDVAALLIIIHNIRKAMFTKFIYRTGDAPTVLEKFSNDDESGTSTQGVLINRFIVLCREVQAQIESEEDGENNEFMSGEYTRILISTQRIEFVLTTKNIIDISYYLESFRKVPTLEDYDEKVWPVPYDYTPSDVFEKNKYDVNLTFPDEK